MNSSIPVLIVGAGPTGLMMACELARHNISFRIIDKKPERTLTANAVAIQPRTLELFDHINIVQRFLKLGHHCDGIQIHAEGKELTHVSLKHLDSIYQFILTLPQSETERLLNTYLEEFQYEVERPLELIDLKQQDNTVLATVQHSDGHTETISSQWLIACDGANSKVRSLCQISFPGEDLTEQFMVADAQMSSFLSTHEVHLFLNKGVILVAVPLSSIKYRIAVNLHQTPRKFIIEKEVKELVQERSQGAYDVNNVSWISPFWIHGKIVKNMRQGSIFLAGDAAHIHSPAGGQGMNTGLQDAYNLSWKLALIIKGKAKPSLLDTYHQERYPIVNEIVERAERFTKLVMVENIFLLQLRNLIFKILHKRAKSSKTISMRLTQLSIRYKNSSAIDSHHEVSIKSPHPGERAPNVIIDSTICLFDYFRHTQHNALLFTGLSSKEIDLKKISELQKWFTHAFPNLIKPHIIITKENKEMNNSFIVDSHLAIHQRYGIQDPALYIIRPDNYIAYCSKNLDSDNIKKFLNQYLY